ncbi:hypothetical protein N9B82_01935 [Saprospiraceae bacterium]|nr:hypothetical protein [Saprospiraceae bacterium]
MPAEITFDEIKNLNPESQEIIMTLFDAIATTGKCKSFADELSSLEVKLTYLLEICAAQTNTEIDKKSLERFKNLLLSQKLVLKFNIYISNSIRTQFMKKAPIGFSTWEKTRLRAAGLYKYINLIELIKNSLKVSKTNLGKKFVDLTAQKTLCVFSRLFHDFDAMAVMHQIKEVGIKTRKSVIRYEKDVLNSNRSSPTSQKNTNLIDFKSSQEVDFNKFDFSKYANVFFIGHGNEKGFRYETLYGASSTASRRLTIENMEDNFQESQTVFLLSCSSDFYKQLKKKFKFFGISKDGLGDFEYHEMFFYGYSTVLAITDDQSLACKAGLMCSEIKVTRQRKFIVTKKDNSLSGYSRIKL